MMVIKRDGYLSKLISKINNGLIKVITGVRRCGKTYLLFNLFHDYLLLTGVPESHIIEIALDDRSNKRFRDPDNMLEYVKGRIEDAQTYYIRKNMKSDRCSTLETPLRKSLLCERT